MNLQNKQEYKYIGLSFVGVAMLGLAIVPFTAQAATATTTINSTIGSVISVFTTSSTVSLNATPDSTGVQSTAKDTVTVGTNSTAGYTLSLKDTDATTSLQSGGATPIPAAAGTFAAPAALTVNTWGYRIDSAGGFLAGPTAAQSSQPISSLKYAGVTAAPVTIKTTAATATSDVTDVWYSLAVNTATTNGSYTDNVTYTATAN